MNLKILALCTLMAIPAFAGKIVTYTASSNVSQEDANNAAMAGVAKQISSQVKVNQTLSKEETTLNGASSYNESYKSSSNVQSNLKLKGISVKPERADKGFKATATLDLDEYTADIQFKMKSIQKDVAKLENQTKQALDDRVYLDAVNAIESAKNMVRDYQYLLSQLSKVYPINESHRLQHDVPNLENTLISRLSDIQIEGPKNQFNLNKPEMPTWEAVVYDRVGPVSNFPLVAKQGRKQLAEKRTQDNGAAAFTLRGINLDKGPNVITVEPAFSDDVLKAAGLRSKLEIAFKVTQAHCSIILECNESSNVCSAVEKALSKKAIFNEDMPGAPILKLTVTANAGQPIEYIPGKFTTPYDIDVSIKGSDITFIGSGHENGKKEADAVSAVLKKMDFTKLQKQLEPYCQ